MTDTSTKPARSGAVLTTLILVAAVANLPLAVANVALPDIGLAFDASQTELNLVAVGYSLGLAASVLWLGAIGDRYGRKMMLLIGVGLSLPAGLVAAFAPNVDVLIIARIVGGIAAGMAYPTTLALIAALWSGPARTRSIALWSATGGAISALGPLISGSLLEVFDWGSVFLVTIPLIVVAIPLVIKFIPSHVNEATDPVDNLGGILSSLLVGAAILAINFASVPDAGTLVLSLTIIGVASLIAFIWRQRRARNPLYDLTIAARPIFWVAAVAGVIVFGSLMAAMFIGQQFLQNVLGYSTIESGAAILPGAVFMVLLAPRSAKLVESRGARFTLLLGYIPVFLGFVTMFVLWREGAPYWVVALGYALVGAGVGLAGTPASRSLTGAVPVKRAGMASGTADLQRDLGGAIMQSLLGALLTAGYAAAFAQQISASPDSSEVSASVQTQLQKSFASAETVAQQYPQYASAITQAARESFLQGQDWAYLAGIAAVVVGAVLVFFAFPKQERERQLLAEYHAEDVAASQAAAPVSTAPGGSPAAEAPPAGTAPETPDTR
ncbi:MFS transporter [Microbacterium sp. 4R-513]|uniref:MFS transporter n=1 Tax=Microbacterium sp. 4R-513 TaxID=2567934 RepID=UPI0013E10844|nr:MFS transporter [Microbacterium sp. 4R-513]QIG40699.1 MFS transporter [Microbacterium sp. 4R-513]